MVELEYRDARRSVREVRLLPSAAMAPVPFERRDGVWTAAFEPPPVDRLEYQLELRYRNGRVSVVCDPRNPARAPGPFGEKSVLELPAYRPPAWLAAKPPRGDVAELAVRSRPFRRDVAIRLWSPAGADPAERLPLLVVHDGPEADEFAGLTRFCAWLVAEERVRPFRAALLQPVARNDHYSASAAWARTLAWDVLPALPVPDRRRYRAAMGMSLGALAALHAHRNHPEAFGGLFLQSGSFFRLATDRKERGFPRFERITRFVGKVLRGEGAEPIPVALTCGLAEENLANNRAVAAALAEQGYELGFGELRDAHTWTGWRDAWHPWLSDLLARLWR
ncbi:MAG: esterase [Thermoleophilia bacterium]|nr:esterase [Thermoleophilia bacterium]